MRTLRVLAPTLLALALPLSGVRAEGADAAAGTAAPPADGKAAAEAAKAEAPQVSAHLQAAKRLYQKLDLDAAMAELREAESDAKAKDNQDELVLILIYKGLIYADLGKTADMAEHFKRALAMRPWTEMPPETSPRIAKQFADARRELWGSPLRPPPKKRKSTAAATPAPANGTTTTVTPPPPMSVTIQPQPGAPAATTPPPETTTPPPAEAPAAPAGGGLEPPK